MDFIDKVKYVRAKLLMTQQILAKQLGVSTATVNRWESQGLQPTFLTETKFNAFCKEKGIDFKEVE